MRRNSIDSRLNLRANTGDITAHNVVDAVLTDLRLEKKAGLVDWLTQGKNNLWAITIAARALGASKSGAYNPRSLRGGDYKGATNTLELAEHMIANGLRARSEKDRDHFAKQVKTFLAVQGTSKLTSKLAAALYAAIGYTSAGGWQKEELKEKETKESRGPIKAPYERWTTAGVPGWIQDWRDNELEKVTVYGMLDEDEILFREKDSGELGSVIASMIFPLSAVTAQKDGKFWLIEGETKGTRGNLNEYMVFDPKPPMLKASAPSVREWRQYGGAFPYKAINLPPEAIVEPVKMDPKARYTLWSKRGSGSWVIERSYTGRYILDTLIDDIREHADTDNPWIIMPENTSAAAKAAPKGGQQWSFPSGLWIVATQSKKNSQVYRFSYSGKIGKVGVSGKTQAWHSDLDSASYTSALGLIANTAPYRSDGSGRAPTSNMRNIFAKSLEQVLGDLKAHTKAAPVAKPKSAKAGCLIDPLDAATDSFQKAKAKAKAKPKAPVQSAEPVHVSAEYVERLIAVLKKAKKALGIKTLRKQSIGYFMRGSDGDVQVLGYNRNGYRFSSIYGRNELPIELQSRQTYTGDFDTDAQNLVDFLAKWLNVSPAPRADSEAKATKRKAAAGPVAADPEHKADPNAKRLNANIQPLYGHYSEKTAYLQDDYPYNRRQRTQRRTWIEHKPKKGYRFVYQTLNPRGFWNKPKASTYTEWAEIMWLNKEDDHIELSVLGQYSGVEAFSAFAQNFPDMPPRMRETLSHVARMKVLMYQKHPVYSDPTKVPAWEAVMKLLKAPTRSNTRRKRKPRQGTVITTYG